MRLHLPPPLPEDTLTRDVDLGRLRLTVHALLDHYREGAGRFVIETSERNLDMQIRIVERHLEDLDSDHPAFLVRARSLLHERAILRRVRAYAPGTGQPGLLTQLARPLRPRDSDEAGKVSTGATGSRPPTALDHVDLLHKVRTGVRKHHYRLVAALQEAHPDTLPPAGDRSWQSQLRALPALATALGPDDDLVRALDRDLQSWRGSVRVHLGYVAPMVTLEDTSCPFCRQPTLIVREDATSDVICTGDGCTNPETGQSPRWHRTDWKRLLAGQYATGVVNTEAALLHLGLTGLKGAATLRDWKRRGLIDHAGGTPRKPFWRVADLDTASEQIRQEMQAREERRARKEAAAEAANDDTRRSA
jgi:hypothetical protein